MTQPGVPDPGTRPTTDGGKPLLPVAGLGAAFTRGTNPTALDAAINAGGDSIAAPLNAVRAWISDRHNWVRVAWFGGGIVMFAIGAAMLAGRPAGQAIATVVPAGKAAKAVKAIT